MTHAPILPHRRHARQTGARRAAIPVPVPGVADAVRARIGG